MKLVTTGRGEVRFNANLYQNGKVCLSLLGTWQGPGWDPEASSLLQVVESIPFNIMIGEPISGHPWLAVLPPSIPLNMLFSIIYPPMQDLFFFF